MFWLKRYARNLSLCQLLLGLLGLTSGCAGIHLYNAGEHQLAQNAQTTLADAKLGNRLDSQRERIRDISTKDKESVRQHGLATRNQSLVTLLGDDQGGTSQWSWLRKQVTERSKKLVGQEPNEAQKSLHLTFNKLAQQKILVANSKRDIEQVMRALALSAPNLECPMSAEALQTIPAPFQELAQGYAKDCNELLKLVRELDNNAPRGNMLRNLWDDIEEIKNARAAYLTELGVKRKAYKEALESHEKALNSSTASEIRNFSEQLHKLLEQLGQVAQDVSTLESLGFTGLKVDAKIERAQEQRKLIGNVLEAFTQAGGTPVVQPPSDAATPVKVAYSLGVLDRELGRALRYPQLTAMVLENERLRIQIVGLQQQAANAQERLALMERQVESMFNEAKWLVETNLAQDAVSQDCTLDSIHTTMKTKVECRELIVRPILNYTNSWSVGRIMHEEIESQLIGMRHEAALVNSEIALAHWNNLIGIPLGQLVALYESGIKPTELAHLINAIGNAAGLTFIGVRVK